MKSTSENYQIKMAEQCRNRSYVKITIASGNETYIFTDKDIASVSKKEDVDPLSRRVPKETLSFSIFDFDGDYNPSNPIGKWSKLDENSKITIQFGFEISKGTIEWLSPDYYILDAKPTVSSGVASFTASSELCKLTNKYYKGIYANSNLYDLAVSVLEDAGINSQNYEVDNSLKNMLTNAPLLVSTHLNCLQLIAHAARCTLKTVSGVIKIEPFTSTITPDTFVLGLDSISLNGDTISKIETLYKVEANLYQYLPEEESKTIETFSIEVEDVTQCHIEYSLSCEQELAVSSENVTISNIHTYAQAADFTLEGNGTFIVTVTGKKITTSISTSESVISLNINGSTDSEKNQLITSSSEQYLLIYHVANYLLFRMTHQIKYRGNPELETLDALFVETSYGTYINGLILSHSINYNGAISGILTIKSLSEIQGVYLYDNEQDKVSDINDETIGVIGMTDYKSNYSSTEMDDFIEEVIQDV